MYNQKSARDMIPRTNRWRKGRKRTRINSNEDNEAHQTVEQERVREHRHHPSPLRHPPTNHHHILLLLLFQPYAQSPSRQPFACYGLTNHHYHQVSRLYTHTNTPLHRTLPDTHKYTLILFLPHFPSLSTLHFAYRSFSFAQWLSLISIVHAQILIQNKLSSRGFPMMVWTPTSRVLMLCAEIHWRSVAIDAHQNGKGLWSSQWEFVELNTFVGWDRIVRQSDMDIAIYLYTIYSL